MTGAAPLPASAWPRARVIGYGLLGLPLAFAALPIHVHVPSFYAARTGSELAALGGVLLAVRLADAIVDPALGWLADRLPRRPLLLLALLPLALGFAALLNPPPAAGLGWLAASLILTYVGWSAATIAYQALAAADGGDVVGRTRLTAAREAFGLLGVLLAALLPGVLAATPEAGVPFLAWLLPPLLGLAALLLWRTGGSPPSLPAAGAPSLLAGVGRAWADPAFRRLLLVFCANGVAAALPATLFLFFVADVVQAEAAGGPLLALYFVAAALSVPFWVRLAAAWGRCAAWLTAMALALATFAGAILLGAGDVGLFAAICLASGLALGADLTLPAALAADLGERLGQAGACFGLWNFVAKLNLALAAGLALPMLALFGYRPGGGQGLAALAGCYAGLPLCFKLLAAGLLWRWRHDLESHS